VVRWLAGLRAPGLLPGMRALAALGSWLAISALLYGLLAALLVLRRLRQLLVVLAAWILQGVIIQYIVAPLARRPRPFGVVFHTGWDAWALPSEKMAALVITLLGILYGLVPEGRWRQRGKWAAAALVSLVAIAHLYLGVEAPTDVLVAVAAGVAIPLLGFRLPENFDRPFLAESIAAFWRRWHITLSQWLRDYLFIPITRALLRRSEDEEDGEAELVFEDLRLDPSSHEAWRGERPLALTRTEYQLLEMFLRRPRRVLERSFILEEVWGYDFPTTANSLEVYVGYLRRKTEAEGESRLIHTVRGVGYVLKES